MASTGPHAAEQRCPK